jgi:hypothetical protein
VDIQLPIRGQLVAVEQWPRNLEVGPFSQQEFFLLMARASSLLADVADALGARLAG